MAQLMMKNQEQFVPISPPQGSASPKVLETIFFYGDALTEERARNVQWTFRDGDCEVDWLEGLESVHTDWHAKLKSYEVIRYLH